MSSGPREAHHDGARDNITLNEIKCVICFNYTLLYIITLSPLNVDYIMILQLGAARGAATTAWRWATTAVVVEAVGCTGGTARAGLSGLKSSTGKSKKEVSNRVFMPQ